MFCSMCGLAADSGSTLCNNCWEVRRRLSDLLRRFPKWREYVAKLLAIPEGTHVDSDDNTTEIY